jgi:hypothetical protein
LLCELIQLAFIHSFLFQSSERSLLNSILCACGWDNL